MKANQVLEGFEKTDAYVPEKEKQYKVRIKYDNERENNIEDVVIAEHITKNDLKYGYRQAKLNKKISNSKSKKYMDSIRGPSRIDANQSLSNNNYIFIDNEKFMIDDLNPNNGYTFAEAENASSTIERLQDELNLGPSWKIGNNIKTVSTSKLLLKRRAKVTQL